MVIGINGQRCNKKSCEMCERCVYDEDYVEETEKQETCNGCNNLSIQEVCGHKQAYCDKQLGMGGRNIALKIIRDEKEDIEKPFWCHKKTIGMETENKAKCCNGCLNLTMKRENGMNYAYCKGCEENGLPKVIEVTGGVLDTVEKPTWCVTDKKTEEKPTSTTTVMETANNSFMCNGCPRLEFRKGGEKMIAYCKYPNGSLGVVETKVQENAPVKKPNWCQIELEKCKDRVCNRCQFSKTNSYSEGDNDCIDWYCHSNTTHPLCIKLGAGVGEEIKAPKNVCPFIAKENKTEHKMTWLERKEAWNKIKPLIDFKDIKVGEVYHLPPIMDDKRCDILVTGRTDYQITYKKLNEMSNIYYTFYPSSLEVKFLTKHKIKKIEVKQTTASSPQTREYPRDFYDDYDY